MLILMYRFHTGLLSNILAQHCTSLMQSATSAEKCISHEPLTIC